MTPAANTVTGRQKVWTRDHIIQSLRDYAELYGPDFTTAAFNPSVAKWRDDPESRERYLKGNTLRGEPWPALNTIRKAFGGFNAAREAAGLAPNRPGPSAARPQRAHHKHAPIRGVSDAVRIYTRTVPTNVSTDTSTKQNAASAAELTAARKAAKAADTRAVKAELRLEKASERLHDARAVAREAKATATAARKRAKSDANALAAAREELRDVRALLALETGKAERMTTEALSLRTQMAELATRLYETREELEGALELRDLGNPEELEAARTEVRLARERVAAARDAQVAAERAAQAAENRAVKAEAERRDQQQKAQAEAKERRKIQMAVAGHDRPLSPAELAELRSTGPAGPAVFAAAIKDVAKAQARGAREPLKIALRAAATAAIRWRERL